MKQARFYYLSKAIAAMISLLQLLFVVGCGSGKTESGLDITVAKYNGERDTFYVDSTYNVLRRLISSQDTQIFYTARYSKNVLSNVKQDTSLIFIDIVNEKGHFARDVFIDSSLIVWILQEPANNPLYTLKRCNSERKCISKEFRLEDIGLTSSSIIGSSRQTYIKFDSLIIFPVADRAWTYNDTNYNQVYALNLFTYEFKRINYPTKLLLKGGYPSIYERVPHMCAVNDTLYLAQPYREDVDRFIYDSGDFTSISSFTLSHPSIDSFNIIPFGQPPITVDNHHEYYNGLYADTLNKKILRFGRFSSVSGGDTVNKFCVSIFDIQTEQTKHLTIGSDWFKPEVHYFREGSFAVFNQSQSSENPGCFIFNRYEYTKID